MPHIVIHEVTHGTSNRLHGNGSGLGNQGGMMGEGWGDWYAHTMTAEPTDPMNGVHGLGGYSLLGFGATSQLIIITVFAASRRQLSHQRAVR